MSIEVHATAVVDPKAQLAAMTARHRATVSEVAFLNPFGDDLAISTGQAIPDTGYNPLSVLESGYNLKDDCENMGRLLMVTDRRDSGSYWNDEGANPDAEVIKAIRPSMATIPNAMLLLASSPYARKGVLWDMHRQHHGKSGENQQMRRITQKRASIIEHGTPTRRWRRNAGWCWWVWRVRCWCFCRWGWILRGIRSILRGVRTRCRWCRGRRGTWVGLWCRRGMWR